MANHSCPKGHQSNEPDFCSECGAKIQGAPSSALSSTAGTTVPCPDCGAPRTDISSNFCEVCGYNFSTGTHGSIPVASVPPPPPPPIPTPPPPPAPAEPQHWTLTAVVDPTLRDPDGPELPADPEPLILALDKPVNLIGRRSEKRAILPEVSLDLDDAVSHRHALLTRGDDGSLTLRDIGSANGTRLNGADVQPLVDTALHDGDQITLGRWTRITLKAD
jgi:hypothetical protein